MTCRHGALVYKCQQCAGDLIAEDHCRQMGVRYLSHETYGGELWIAVEECGERYEIKVPLTNPQSGLSADQKPSGERPV